MSRLKDRLLNYHIQVKKFADDDQMILANDVLSMIEQLQDDLKWYEKPKLTKTEKSFIEALDPSWSYMLRNGKGYTVYGYACGLTNRMNKDARCRPGWCPLIPLPERHIASKTATGYEIGYEDGWNECLEKIVGGE